MNDTTPGTTRPSGQVARRVTRRIRVLLAKPGLDGHDRGVKVVGLALRDAGFEVIYTGLRQSVPAIVSIALQEDVDVIGLSILSGSHLPLCARMREELAAAGLEDKLWLVGGNIPERDRPALEEMGVAAVFSTSTPLDEIVAFLRGRFEEEQP